MEVPKETSIGLLIMFAAYALVFSLCSLYPSMYNMNLYGYRRMRQEQKC
jgi:hypothetical protein